MFKHANDFSMISDSFTRGIIIFLLISGVAALLIYLKER